jgi:hypothetical protein
MKIYESTNTTTEGLRESNIQLPEINLLFNENESGVEITTYGQGQVTGAIYSVPAHGEITVDLKLRLLCVTPEDVRKLDRLIHSMLDASRQHLYDDLQRTSISGGARFFGFFGWGGARASYERTTRTMNSFGLSERNQQAIIDMMAKLVTQPCEFNYKGTVYNRNNPYSVTGSLFGIIMDATIKQGQYERQTRFIAPNAHFRTNDGSNLPVVGQLYDINA